ncbi:glutathione S-transferase family protein [Vibrio tubiashii]|uniref:glutathione S-transferase family protein n=1 Tax=Vibrio tubiashii TaxID=29498 RepID=UPI003CE53E12
MKLYLNDTSPFSRVVVATALLSNVPYLSLVWVDPWSSPSNLKRVNPLCLIPALELDNGQSLTESLCISQYLIEVNQPTNLKNVQLNDVEQVKLLGTAKTLMEIAFRTAVLPRFTDQDNELIRRGQEGIVLALTNLNKEMEESGLEFYLDPNLATLYLHIGLEYIQFRHRALYDDAAVTHIDEFLNTSPFSQLLELVSIERLSEKPEYSALASSWRQL